MPGPMPTDRPSFPDEVVQRARAQVRKKSAAYRSVQRSQLILLLHENPSLGHAEAGQQVGLSGRQVQHWRRRWAAGDFSVEDRPGRGRKPLFSPPRSRGGQGAGLRARRGNQAAPESTVAGRSGDPGSRRLGQSDQSQYSQPDPGPRCDQTLAISLLDLPAGSAVRPESRTDLGPVRGALAGPTPRPQRLHHLC